MNGMCDRNDFLYDILDDNNFSVEELNKQIMDIENGVQSDSMDDTNTCPTSDDNNEISMDVLQRAVEFELAVIPIARPVSEYHNDFNATESYLLNELFNSTKIIGQPLTKITLEITNMEEFDRTVSFKFDRGIRNFTRGVKGLTAFKNILPEDKISLLKYGCIEALLMRTVMHVDYQEECMRLPWDKENGLMVKLEFLKSFKPEVYNSFIRYLSKMSPIWDSDIAIIDLRYLILKYRSECEAKSRFLRLMNTLNDVNILREMQRKHTLHLCNSSLVTPLLQEVFDVKPTAPVELDSSSIDFMPSPISSDL
ncbi:unnamed protein product [Oppiella nova]|uniref:NR LBD domain-containing protein n=1 Tax=Oppiella nova TaxID=334625 RepID=A0A7R9M9X7_9ACAR|nr:unnamed protein product [Oppiella nova]CAG2173479.1 unnamed protein product [Oppiella nova]